MVEWTLKIRVLIRFFPFNIFLQLLLNLSVFAIVDIAPIRWQSRPWIAFNGQHMQCFGAQKFGGQSGLSQLELHFQLFLAFQIVTADVICLFHFIILIFNMPILHWKFKHIGVMDLMVL